MEPVTLKAHIECDSAKCNGKPVVAGTRIRVWDIHVWRNLRGQSPEEIVTNFPQLPVVAVHAALAYFLDHRESIEKQMKEADDLASRLASEQGPTRFSRLRDELANGRDVNDDSIPSG